MSAVWINSLYITLIGEYKGPSLYIYIYTHTHNIYIPLKSIYRDINIYLSRVFFTLSKPSKTEANTNWACWFQYHNLCKFSITKVLY